MEMKSIKLFIMCLICTFVFTVFVSCANKVDKSEKSIANNQENISGQEKLPNFEYFHSEEDEITNDFVKSFMGNNFSEFKNYFIKEICCLDKQHNIYGINILCPEGKDNNTDHPHTIEIIATANVANNKITGWELDMCEVECGENTGFRIWINLSEEIQATLYGE